MTLVDQSVRGITRRMGPTRLGSLLSRWAQKRFSIVGASREDQNVIAEHSDHGLRMRVNPAHHIGGAIYWRGFHSGRILRCLDQILRPSMTMFDVGANQGEVTLYAARRLSLGKVVAFEPLCDNHLRLVDNVQLNGLSNVTIRNHCLGEQPGRVQLFAAEAQSRKHRNGWNEGLASMFAAGSQSRPVSSVDVHRLDDVFPTLGVSTLDVLKIDVEGAELPVLRGARDSIIRFQPRIIVEMNAESFRSAGYAMVDVWDFLDSLNYEGLHIDRSGIGRKVNLQDMPTLCDMLWCPRSQ